MAVRLISAYLAQKRLNPTSRHDVRLVHEKFSSRRFKQAHGCQAQFGIVSTRKFDSYFLDMMYV